MKKKSIILGFMCLLIVFALTGCGNKKSITTDDFKSMAQNHSYTTTDVISQYASYDYIKEATVARSSNDWQVEFYVLDGNANATSMFNTNKEIFETYKSGSTSESSSNIGNHSSYSLTTSDYYMHLCRVNNTLLYVKVANTYKNEVTNFINELGY